MESQNRSEEKSALNGGVSDFIRIERVSIPTWPGKGRPCYFVDRVTRMEDGSLSAANWASSFNYAVALSYAREFGLYIENRVECAS